MQVSFDWPSHPSSALVVDIDDVFGEVTDDATPLDAVLMAILHKALKAGCDDFDSIYLEEYITDAGDEISIPSAKLYDTLEEVVKLAEWTNKRYISSWESERAHAFLNEDWNDVDFDNLRDLGDRVSFEFEEDDYEVFGKEYAEVMDIGVDESLEPYVDWNAYGKSMAESYNEVTWNGKTYLVSY